MTIPDQTTEAVASEVLTSEPLDMSMKADADVNWKNPDALTREQLIRVNAFGCALQLRSANFERGRLASVLDDADAIAAWVTDGTRVEVPEPVGATN